LPYWKIEQRDFGGAASIKSNKPEKELHKRSYSPQKAIQQIICIATDIEKIGLNALACIPEKTKSFSGTGQGSLGALYTESRSSNILFVVPLYGFKCLAFN